MSEDTRRGRYELLKEWGHPDVQYQHGPNRGDHYLTINGFKVPAATNVVIEDDAAAACPKVTVTVLAASVNKPEPVNVDFKVEHARLAAIYGWTPDVLRRMAPDAIEFFLENAPKG